MAGTKPGHDEDAERRRDHTMNLLAKISTATDERSARLAGIGLMLLSVFMFSFGDALGKFIVATYSVGQLLLLRACRGADRAVAVDLAAAAGNSGGWSGRGCSCCG